MLDPPLNKASGIVRAGNIDGLAVATEPKHRAACVRAHVAEHPLHRCEVLVRRETDRLPPRSKIAQQLAGVARIDGNHRRPASVATMSISKTSLSTDSNITSLMPRQNVSIRNELNAM